MGEARDVEVETRTEESEAGKEEGRWKRRPHGGRSLSQSPGSIFPGGLTREQGSFAASWSPIRRGHVGEGAEEDEKGRVLSLSPSPQPGLMLTHI